MDSPLYVQLMTGVVSVGQPGKLSLALPLPASFHDFRVFLRG